MIRPKTGFVKKDENDLKTADLSEVEKYLDCFYEDDFDVKVKGARMILYLSIDPSKMVQLANENLFNILSRSLKEDHKRNPEFLIHLLAFFYGYSCYETFHEILASYGVGETCMSIIDFQFAKFTIRKEDLQKKREDKDPKFKPELDKFFFMIRKQDRILKLAFSVLINLADNPKIEKKMVKKDIVVWLQNYLDRSNINLIVMVLLFLKKLSVYDINKDAMIKNVLLNQLSSMFGYTHQLIISLSLDIIYNLSFDSKFVLQIVERPEVFRNIIGCFKIQNLRGLVLRVLFNISKEATAKPLFADTDCIYILYELIIKFPEPRIGVELAALTLNLTTCNKNSDILADEEKIKCLMERAFSNNDFYLIKIVKNIIKYSEVEELSNMFKSFIDQFFETLQNKTGTEEFSSELIEILSSIEADWEEKLEKYGLIEFLESNLEINSSKPEVLLKFILFIGNIAGSSVSNF